MVNQEKSEKIGKSQGIGNHLSEFVGFFGNSSEFVRKARKSFHSLFLWQGNLPDSRLLFFCLASVHLLTNGSLIFSCLGLPRVESLQKGSFHGLIVPGLKASKWFLYLFYLIWNLWDYPKIARSQFVFKNTPQFSMLREKRWKVSNPS